MEASPRRIRRVAVHFRNGRIVDPRSDHLRPDINGNRDIPRRTGSEERFAADRVHG